MQYKISTDNGNGQPVQNAVITFAKNGVVFNTVPFPNNTGVLYFDSVNDADLFQADVVVRVEAPGRVTAGTTGNAIGSDWTFTLQDNGLQTALLVGGGAAAAIFILSSMGNKKKKIAGINVKKDVLPWLPVAGIAVGGYVAYLWLNKMFGDPQAKARGEALDKDIKAAEAMEPSRMSDSEISTTANAIKEDLTYFHVYGSYDYLNDAAHQLTKPGTTADMLRLIKAYGTVYITYFGIPAGKFTLEETVTRKMPADYIAEINRYYDAQGIDFNF